MALFTDFKVSWELSLHKAYFNGLRVNFPVS